MTLRIARVRVTPIAIHDPPLLNAQGVHEPFGLRSIVEVEGSDGLVGLGETYGDAPVLALLQAAAGALPGRSAFDLNSVWSQVVEQAKAMPRQGAVEMELAPGSKGGNLLASAFSALEVACLDLQARHLGVPLAELLGGAVRDAVPYSAYLFYKYASSVDAEYADDPWGEALTPAQIVAQARRMIDLHGFQSIKLKAGVFDPDAEADTILALREAFPQRALRIDPNGNWSLATSERIAERLAGVLEYYEDPTPTLEGMAELHRRTGLPLATNMVVTNWDELRESVARDAVQIVLSDHHYWGGLRATQALARTCSAFGLGLSMHSNSHLGISLMAMTHLAAATPHLSYACDTHYPWQAEDVLAGGRVPIEGGCVRITKDPGLGIALDADRLAERHQAYLACRIRTRNDSAQMQRLHPEWRSAKPRY